MWRNCEFYRLAISCDAFHIFHIYWHFDRSAFVYDLRYSAFFSLILEKDITRITFAEHGFANKMIFNYEKLLRSLHGCQFHCFSFVPLQYLKKSKRQLWFVCRYCSRNHFICIGNLCTWAKNHFSIQFVHVAIKVHRIHIAALKLMFCMAFDKVHDVVDL